MRTLTGNLETNQKSWSLPPRLKAVFTQGATTKTYDISSTPNNPILSLAHTEQEFSQIAYIAILSDPTIAALDLEGYTATLSYGYYDPTNGDEYSACAPLSVVAQKSNTILDEQGVRVTTYFTCAGIFDMMSSDKASESYSQEDTDTNTVKTLLTAIAEATLTPFANHQAYTITFDSEDSLIDTYIPADYFYVSVGESRLAAFQKLLQTTKCKARIEDDGEIHVYNPTVSGAVYDYQYNDAATNHNFFEKGVRKRLVIPNRFIVQSHPSHAEPYYGTAEDSDSYTALGRYIDSAPFYIRATSDAQCAAIAAAKLQQLQVDSAKGSGKVPMNCGQEVGDYIKFTDSIASDTRTGNVGMLTRRYSIGKNFDMKIDFGTPTAEMPFMQGAPGTEQVYVTWEAWSELISYIDKKDIDILNTIAEITTDGVMAKLQVTGELIIPTELG